MNLQPSPGIAELMSSYHDEAQMLVPPVLEEWLDQGLPEVAEAPMRMHIVRAYLAAAVRLRIAFHRQGISIDDLAEADAVHLVLSTYAAAAFSPLLRMPTTASEGEMVGQCIASALTAAVDLHMAGLQA